MKSENIVRIEDLNVYGDDHHILKNINLEIPRNKVTVLLGPSGCGKTTMLKCLNRLIDLYPELKATGKIFIDEENIFDKQRDVTEIRQQMGLLSQKPYPLPMSIFGNIAYGLKLHGIKKKRHIAGRVENHLREVALWNEVKDRLHSPASRLSIGQQQRLCLARGLAVKPKIILADEPTSALDPISSKIIERQFSTLKQDHTLIIVTHIMRQAKRLADNVVFMYLGEIVEQGKPEVIFNDPSTDTLKAYLRDGN